MTFAEAIAAQRAAQPPREFDTALEAQLLAELSKERDVERNDSR